MYLPDDAKVKGWRECVTIAARPHLQPGPLQGPLLVSIAFFFERPKRLLRSKDPDHPIPYDAKPDRDNSEKAVTDALTDLGLWHDDCQAMCGGISKWYVERGGRPGAFVVIQTVGEDAWLHCTDQAVYQMRDRGGIMGHAPQRDLPGVVGGGGTVGDLFAGVPVDRPDAVDRTEPVDADDDFDDVDDDLD